MPKLRRRGAANLTGTANLTGMMSTWTSLLEVCEGADAAPTRQAVTAADEAQRSLSVLLVPWQEIKTKDVPSLNERLRRANLPTIQIENGQGR